MIKHWFFALLGFMHLIMVAIHAAYLRIPDESFIMNAMTPYLVASGANSSYGFFAPSIGAKIHGFFNVTDSSENTHFFNLSDQLNREANIRLGGIFEEFTSEEAQDPIFRQNLGKSLAAAVFKQFDDARSVVLNLEEYAPLSMEAYRNGERMKWERIYEATFEKNL